VIDPNGSTLNISYGMNAFGFNFISADYSALIHFGGGLQATRITPGPVMGGSLIATTATAITIGIFGLLGWRRGRRAA
jgi:hypothetical protein